MAQSGGRIPAWRRLGLGLKNEAQSGGTTIDSRETHRGESEQAVVHDAPRDSHLSIAPAANGTPSKLGKRKHQQESADDDGQASKKSKENHPATEPSVDLPILTVSESVDASAASEEVPVSETQQSKGDSNYRKKKAKPDRKKKIKTEAAPVVKAPQKQPSYERAARPALSPDETTSTERHPTLLASIETDNTTLPPLSTPQRHQSGNRTDSKEISGSPSRTGRRKSVTFTPDTKKVDGSSGQDLFKKWVAELKGTSSTTTEPVQQHVIFDEVDQVEEVKKADKNEAEKKKPKEPKTSTPKTTPATAKPVSVESKDTSAVATTPNAAKGKKKDPSIYISYLTQYHNDRSSWKFNKAKQNDVVDNALNIFRIPDEHSEALLEYIKGLQGAGVIQRLKERCHATITELNEQDAQDPKMDDPETRTAAQDEALQERVVKEQKRRKVEGYVETLMNHPHGDGYIRRLRRSRAEALLTALGCTAPILPVTQTNSINPMAKNLAPPVRDSKRRKRRGDISSSDESSSSEEESSDSDSSDDDDSSSDSDSASPSAKSGSGSGSGSDSDDDSASGESDSSDSDSD